MLSHEVRFFTSLADEGATTVAVESRGVQFGLGKVEASSYWISTDITK